MYLLYSSLLTLGFIILLPRFAFDAFRNGKYVTGLRQRLGDLPHIDRGGSPVIWLHCVSVGEAQAAQSLIRALARVFPDFRLVISTTTVTGQKVAQQSFAQQAAAIFYFPIDWAWTVRRALRTIQPAAIIVMETELWPRLFRESRRRGTPVALVNGRISNKSFRRYRRIRGFMRRVLNDLAVAVMQTEIDARRICELGLNENRIRIAGNLKFDSAASEADERLTTDIRDRFGIADDRPLIVAASTHGGEEVTILNAFRKIEQLNPSARLMLAPRHPERFSEVASLLDSSGFKFVRRSSPPSPNDAPAAVILLDTIGELRAVYPLASVVFVGGSLVPHGGHSVIEPARYGVCTITGPHTQNFAAIVEAMRDQDALIQLTTTEDAATELAAMINQVLDDHTMRRSIGERARAVCEHNQGATEKTIEFLSQILDATQSEHRQIVPPSLEVTAAK